MFFERFISKLFSFNSFLVVNLKNRVITNEVIGKKERFFYIDTLLLLCSHRLKINNILSLSISKTILYLFIYNFSKIRSYCFKKRKEKKREEEEKEKFKYFKKCNIKKYCDKEEF